MVVALDASAAFGLINKEFLLNSMKRIGAGKILRNWLENYLAKETCYVMVEAGESSPWETDTGVIRDRSIHHTDISSHGLFTTQTIHHTDYSPLGHFTTRTIHHKTNAPQLYI